MKKMCLLLLLTVVLCFLSSAGAQPRQTSRYEMSPGESVNLFLSSCSSGSVHTAAQMVQGADAKTPALANFGKEIAESFGNFTPSARKFKLTLDPQDSSRITADFIVVLHDEMGHSVAQADSVVLKKNDSQGYTFWMIIPETPQEFNSGHSFYMGDLPPKKSELTTQLATEIAYPEQMQTQFHLSKSMSQMKQLGLGLMMLIQDYDQIVQVDQLQLKKTLYPYVQSEIIFTAPGDPPGTTSYHINPNVEGLNIKNIKEIHSLVGLYLGNDQKLEFRYGGLSPVLFMDGHVKAVTPEEAKNLRWKP